MSFLKSVSIFFLGAFGCVGVSVAAHAAGNAETGKTKSAACAACHGADGNGNPANAEWPKLAGQDKRYILKQLNEFKSGKRANDLMSPMAKPLSSQDMEDLAAYFSSQKVIVAGGAAANVSGQKLYREGTMKPVVLACTGCHGAGGGGNSAWQNDAKVAPFANAPAIGGQNAVYLAKQLRAFKAGARANDTNGVMRNIAINLTDKDIEEVTAYATRLTR
jgi:cytochrome c553